MSQIYTYLNFENTKEALEYYESVFFAKILSRTPAMPEMVAKTAMEELVEDTTMHSVFSIFGNLLMASDRFGRTSAFGDAMTIMLDFNSEDEDDNANIKKLYDSVVLDGQSNITMPLAEQFWGGSMACFIDKFGVSWMLHSQPYSKLEM